MFVNRIVRLFISKIQFSTTSTLTVRKGPNPGVNKFLNEMNDVQEEISEDPESFGNFESDFMHVHKTHKEHSEEMKAYKEFIRLKIVKNKYFKEKYPNFLTFAEKEQIRLLHEREPDVWNIEKLCESFPASDETIIKILKGRWYPRSEKRLKTHDEKVMTNWEKFRKGEFPDLPPELTDHLKKFVERKPSDLKNIETKWLPKRPVIPKPKTDEFLSILTSCKGYKEKNLIEENGNKKKIEAGKTDLLSVNNFEAAQNHGDDETFVFGNIENKKPITLSFLKSKIGLSEKEESLPVKLGEKIEEKKILDDATKVNPFSSSKNKLDFSEITISNSDIQKYKVDPIKERIHIPNKLWKRGATYKVKDCYYDYDGTFLYRVPGMTGDIKKEDS
ncbi:uncharacterized protein LOC129605356 [Condylostylus longicornis]|uniref:uncharacterized protein LOC129605356 n=1 Tax=Condylostylus longicornis TaxID=2530218 RepID=UPI00244E3A05|nr:uncharacterized protein LOC129605356 [Condylostylus longicornis]